MRWNWVSCAEPEELCFFALTYYPVSYTHLDVYKRQAAEPAQVVDTTGAGDAFNGALAASLAQQPALAFIEHVRFASRYAARSTEHAGAALAMPNPVSYTHLDVYKRQA